MIKSLQRTRLYSLLHIALFIYLNTFGASLYAQSLIVPGDIAVVTVNSTTATFEFVPLIDLEKGTELHFVDQIFEPAVDHEPGAHHAVFKAKGKIEAGTILSLGQSESTKRYDFSGGLQFEGNRRQLYIYQNDAGVKRYIFGVLWGEKTTSDVDPLPIALTETRHNLIKLGDNYNYQYYIRNGLSGTPEMILSFLSDPANWRGANDRAFSALPTSFNILTPPVILFDQNLSTITENGGIAKLNVAIYQHDGSRLNLDIVFDSVYSSLSKTEFDSIYTQNINFTGLIGNAVYEVEFPIVNDDIYEGTETAIFNIENLTKGSLGDFVSHTVRIQDDEQPSIQMEYIDSQVEPFLIINNEESVDVNLSRWVLTNGVELFEFPLNTVIQANTYLYLFTSTDSVNTDKPDEVLRMDISRDSFFQPKSTIQLLNLSGYSISEIKIPKKKEDKSTLVLNEESVTPDLELENLTTLPSQVQEDEAVIESGWVQFSQNELNEMNAISSDLYVWDEKSAKFKVYNESEVNAELKPVVIGYLTEEEAKTISKSSKKKVKDNEVGGSWKVELSATDADSDERINQFEGINFLVNTSGMAMQTGWLVEQLRKELGEAVQPTVYRLDRQTNRILYLEQGKFIGYNDWFLIKLNNVLEPTIIGLDINSAKAELDLAEPIVQDSYFSINMVGAGFDQEVRINFNEEGKEAIQIPSLNHLMEFKLPAIDFAAFYMKSGEFAYEELELPEVPSTSFSYELDYVSSKAGSYTLSIGKWEQVPSDWVIVIKDRVEDREYVLDENWKLELEYIHSTEPSESKLNLEEMGTIEPLNRFELKFIPKSIYYSVEELDKPTSLELYQNYPNPFNPFTTIAFYLPEENEVKLSIFNIVGQPVAVLIDQTMATGKHEVNWDAVEMPSGMYIYQLEVGNRIMTRKMTLVK